MGKTIYTATVTIPAGTYTADGLSILLSVPEDEVGRLMAAAARETLDRIRTEGLPTVSRPRGSTARTRKQRAA